MATYVANKKACAFCAYAFFSHRSCAHRAQLSGQYKLFFYLIGKLDEFTVKQKYYLIAVNFINNKKFPIK